MIDIGSIRTQQRGLIRVWMVAPFIYGMAIPLCFIDVCTQLYQAVCFPVYGMPLIARSKYHRRRARGAHHIKPLDRFNCWYCAYANGVLMYAQAVIGQTERYWCPLRHALRKGAAIPAHQAAFVAEKDEKALVKYLKDNP